MLQNFMHDFYQSNEKVKRLVSLCPRLNCHRGAHDLKINALFNNFFLIYFKIFVFP
jgi:hypothetical protein